MPRSLEEILSLSMRTGFLCSAVGNRGGKLFFRVEKGLKITFNP
jgi:hypothetical protein